MKCHSLKGWKRAPSSPRVNPQLVQQPQRAVTGGNQFIKQRDVNYTSNSQRTSQYFYFPLVFCRPTADASLTPWFEKIRATCLDSAPQKKNVPPRIIKKRWEAKIKNKACHNHNYKENGRFLCIRCIWKDCGLENQTQKVNSTKVWDAEKPKSWCFSWPWANIAAKNFSFAIFHSIIKEYDVCDWQHDSPREDRKL